MPSLDTQDRPSAYLWDALSDHKKIAVSEVSQLTARPTEKKFTFVFDLDNTLINTVLETGVVLLRPGVIEFLKYLKDLDYVEIIIWSAGKKIHVDKCAQLLESYIDQAIAKGIWDSTKKVELLTCDGSRNLDEIIIIDDKQEVCEANKGHAVAVLPFFHRKIHQKSTDNVFFKLHRYCSRALLEPFNALKFKERFLFLTEKLKPASKPEESLPLLKHSHFQQAMMKALKEPSLLPEIKVITLIR